MPVTRISDFGRLFDERRRFLVDRPLAVGFDRAGLVNRLADHIHDAAKRLVANRHGDRLAGIDDVLPAHQTFGRIHGDRPHGVFTEMLGNFQHQPVAVVVGFQCVENLRQMILELHVDNGADDLRHTSDSFVGGGLFLAGCSFRHDSALANSTAPRRPR